MKCSLCGKSFDRNESKSMPFCSPRCKQIDLGNWLNESYGLPVETDDYREEDLD
ncbi:MAG: DNA gyrase inhibitor YacG [Planctomycetota bacterium]